MVLSMTVVLPLTLVSESVPVFELLSTQSSRMLGVVDL